MSDLNENIKDVNEKPDQRFYDVTIEEYNKNTAEAFRQFYKEITDDAQVMAHVGSKQKTTITIDTSMGRK